MKLYESLGAEALMKNGFTIDFLIADHQELLKRLRLESDMGEGNIPNQGKDGDPQDLESVAAYIIYNCIQWPYPDNAFGFDMKGYLQDAACQYISEYNIQPYGNINKSRIVDAALAAKHPRVLRDIHSENQTPDVIEKALKRNPEQFKVIAQEKKSVDYALMALNNNPAVFPMIEEQYWTKHLIDQGIQKNGLNLGFIKEDQKTATRCAAAVKQNPGAIVFVPQHLQTAGLLKTALSGDGLSVEHINDELITPDLQKVAIKENAHVLMIKESFCTPENIKLAAKHHPEIKGEKWFKDLVLAIKNAPSEPER